MVSGLGTVWTILKKKKKSPEVSPDITFTQYHFALKLLLQTS